MTVILIYANYKANDSIWGKCVNRNKKPSLGDTERGVFGDFGTFWGALFGAGFLDFIVPTTFPMPFEWLCALVTG